MNNRDSVHNAYQASGSSGNGKGRRRRRIFYICAHSVVYQPVSVPRTVEVLGRGIAEGWDWVRIFYEPSLDSCSNIIFTTTTHAVFVTSVKDGTESVFFTFSVLPIVPTPFPTQPHAHAWFQGGFPPAGYPPPKRMDYHALPDDNFLLGIRLAPRTSGLKTYFLRL